MDAVRLVLDDIEAGTVPELLVFNKADLAPGVAKELVGIDIDDEGIAHASRHGIEILKANCESMDLGCEFDVIVLSE